MLCGGLGSSGQRWKAAGLKELVVVDAGAMGLGRPGRGCEVDATAPTNFLSDFSFFSVHVAFMFDLHAACMTLRVATGLFVHCSLVRSARWRRLPWYQPQSFELGFQSKRMPLWKCTFGPAALALQCSDFARLGLHAPPFRTRVGLFKLQPRAFVSLHSATPSLPFHASFVPASSLSMQQHFDLPFGSVSQFYSVVTATWTLPFLGRLRPLLRFLLNVPLSYKLCHRFSRFSHLLMLAPWGPVLQSYWKA